MPHETMSRPRGFTLLELITVMIILAVLGTVLATRAMDDTAQVTAELEAVKSHLRFAQSRAMADSADWYVQFTAHSYTLHEAGVGSKPLPGAETLAAPLAYHSAAPGSVVLFDKLGRPYTDAAGNTAQSGRRTVLSSAGAGNLEIMPETGFIP